MALPAMTIDKSQFPEAMNLRLASVYVDLSEQRLRTITREGNVPGASKDESGAWVFTKAGLDEYLTQRAAQPRRGGGGPRGEGKAWVIRVKHENYDAVVAALEPFGISLEPRYNYAKQMEYRKKRQAKLAAEKTAAGTKPAAKTAAPSGK